MNSKELIFPQHECGLYLTHNQHRDYHQTLSEYIQDHELEEDFENAKTMARAIETDELWELQWYPHTPVGFIRVVAPTLEEVLELGRRG